MVDPVVPITATEPSTRTHINDSTSIGSEPQNVWVAHRQSQMTADFERQGRARRAHHEDDTPEPQYRDGLYDDGLTIDGDQQDEPRHRHLVHATPDSGEEAAEDCTLSGESDRIGTQNFDDDTPFGERVAII